MSECTEEIGRKTKMAEENHHHYLYHINEVEKKLLCILLPIGGKLRVASPNQSFEHTRCYANLVTLNKHIKIIACKYIC